VADTRTTLTRDDLAEILRRIAHLLELRGENPFKIRAYRNAAEAVEAYPGDIVGHAARNELEGIAGIGEAIAAKLHELVSTGRMEFWEKLRDEFPDTIFELFEVNGLGPKKIKALHDALGVDSLARLKEVCASGEAAGLPGFGAKSVARIQEEIAFRERHAGTWRLGDVAAWAEEILSALRAHPATSRAEAAGSFRRGKETVRDLDFVVATKRPEEILAFFASAPWTAEVLVRGETKCSIRVASGLQCDLRAVANTEFACALNYFTGSKEHNVALRSRALKRGFSLNEYGLTPLDPASGPAPELREEADLYRFLGLDAVDPALRENNGELEAAEAGELPVLVEIGNLRGTFHNHTDASDGRDTLEAMAEAAQDLGLQYLGIADHSRSSVQARGLDETRLRAQIEAIRRLNDGFGPGFRLFAGSEVDILRDGSLDFGDDLLGELDYVVASVHNAFQLPEAEMTERLLRAVEHPRVTMLGHLTGRLLLQREPYAVDIPRILEACARTGTWIELNANPWRLDLDWRWWKLAKEQGVKCVINPDAHRTSDLQFLHFGVLQARKGWLTRADVVNCLPLETMQEELAARRGTPA
jgi:DNA polymerase (family 10)